MTDTFNPKLYYYYDIFRNLVFQRGLFILFFYAKGLSGLEIGILQAAVFIATALFELPTGILSDIIGRKKIILFGLFCLFFSGLGFALSGQFSQFLFFSILEGIGTAHLNGTDESLLYENLKNNTKYQYLNIYSISSSFAFYALGVSTFLGGLLYKISWNLIYYAYCFSLAIAFLSIYKLRVNESVDKRWWHQISMSRLQLMYRDLLKSTAIGNKYFIFIFFPIVSLFEATNLCFYMYNQKVFAAKSLTPFWIAIIFTLSRFVSAYACHMAIYFDKKLSINLFLSLGLGLTTILIYCIKYTGIVLTISIFILLVFVYNMVSILINNYIHESIPTQTRSTLISFKNMLSMLLIALIYFSGGLLLNRFSASVAISYLFVFPLIALIIQYFYQRICKINYPNINFFGVP